MFSNENRQFLPSIVIEELDKSLEDVQAKHVSKISKENADDKNVYETLGQRNMEIIEDINKTMRDKLKVVQFIDPKQLKILRDSLEMMKDENLVHLTFDYIAGFDYETLDKFEAEELAQGEMAGAVKPAKNKPE